MHHLTRLFAAFAALNAAAALAAPPRFAAWLSDGAVLQRGATVAVAGTAEPGARVAVSLASASATVRADKKGAWRASLPAAGLAQSGLVLTASVGSERSELRDLALGDVFLCSGQSNMAMSLSASAMDDDKRRQPIDASIRLLKVPVARSQVVQNVFHRPVQWKGAVEAGADFSAVCLLTAREIARRHRVTVGLVEADLGGTPIEAWLPREGLEMAGASKAVLDMLEAYRIDETAAAAKYAAQIERDWEMRAPTATNPGHRRIGYASLFNTMVAPLAGARFSGVIWYQGENNAARKDTIAGYRASLAALLASWRKWFGESLPFVIVQIAPFGPLSDQPVGDSKADVREAQRLVAASDPKAALVTTIDVGERLDIHPPLKWPVARRAADAIEHLVYGGSAVLLGPQPGKASIVDGVVHLAIDGAKGGLMAASWGRPGPFTVCDAGGTCTFADARLEGDGILVDLPPDIVAATVRYCWDAAPICNVFDRDQRPLGPFELPVTAR